MTSDDIIRIAQEAGLHLATDVNWMPIIGLEYAEKFSALVAAAKREKVAHWMMQRGYATGHGDTLEDLLQELEWQIAENWTRAMVNGAKTAREQCWQAIEAVDDGEAPEYRICQEAIRALEDE